MPMTRASTPKWPSASTSWAATFSCPAVSGRLASALERLRKRGVGDRPLEVRRLGDLGPVAALRRELLGRSGVVRATPGSSFSGSSARRGSSSGSGSSGSGSDHSAVGSRSSASPSTSGSVSSCSGNVRAIALARGGGPSSSAASSSVAGRRRWTAVRTSRVVVATESLVALTTPATDAPVSSSTAAAKRKIAIVCAPRSPSSGRGRPVEPLPHHAAARLDPLRLPATGPPPGPEAERAGREAERERGEQADRAGPERPHRGQHGPQHEDRAGRHQRGGDDVVAGAEQRPQAVDGAVAGLAAVPVEVDDEGEEDGGGDEAEPDDVEVALLELRQAARQRARSGGRGAWPSAWPCSGLGLGRRRAGGIWAEPPSTRRARTLPPHAAGKSCR